MQRSGDARGDCLNGCPLPNYSIEQWRVVVIVYWIYAVSDVTNDVMFRFGTNVLAKFVDTTCIFSGAGEAVGQGEQQNSLGQWKLIKKQKNRFLLCLFLFISNVDLKYNNRNYRKSFRIFWVLEKLQWLYFKWILINYQITYGTIMKSSGVEGGDEGGVQAHPQKMWFAENRGNITENPRKNGAQHCLT